MQAVPISEVIEREAETDETFRADWERLAPARAFAGVLIRYRFQDNLTQTALGRLLGVSQSRVAQLESGERNPDLDTIMNAVRALDIEFVIDVRPAGKPAVLATKRAQATGTNAGVGGIEIIAAAA